MRNANDIWKFPAKGDYTVDAQTKLQAQQDISDDGYYGVKQTADRLFDFASALAGDDVDKMKKMQAAMQKGFDQATKAWETKLPDISKHLMLQTRSLKSIISRRAVHQQITLQHLRQKLSFHAYIVHDL